MDFVAISSRYDMDESCYPLALPMNKYSLKYVTEASNITSVEQITDGTYESFTCTKKEREITPMDQEDSDLHAKHAIGSSYKGY